MSTQPPSRLFDYNNRNTLDDLRLNAFASDGSTSTPRIPPELLYEPFQQFLVDTTTPLRSLDDERMSIPSLQPPSDYFRFVTEFLRCTARRYAQEEHYSQALNSVLTKLIGVTMGRNLTPRGPGEREGNADGAIVYTPLGASRHFIIIRKDTLGSGSGGGDSMVELVGHYQNILLCDPPRPTSPTILVEVVGTRLIISLAACDNERKLSIAPAVLCKSLNVQAAPEPLFAELAAVFIGLRRLTATIAGQCTTGFPQPLYSQEARRGPNLVFQRPDGGFDKFLRQGASYGEDAHNWCSTMRFAPTFVVKEVCPGWKKVQMEATGDEWKIAVGAAGSSLRDKVVAKVTKMLHLLHEAGYVHGDVRASNVIYRVGKSEKDDEHQQDVQVMLIDFDDAGRVPDAHYSLLPFNPDVPSHPNVMPGGKIDAEHDLWRVEDNDRFFK